MKARVLVAGAVALAVTGTAYAAGVTVATRQTRGTLEHDADWVHLPGAFAAMHVGWGYGFWAGLARGIRSRLFTKSGDEPSPPSP